MKIKTKVAQELANFSSDIEVDGFVVVQNELIDAGRWSLHYSLTVMKDNQYYQTAYSRGSTECQDERPFEYEGEEVEFVEVIPNIETVTIYRTKNEIKHS